MKTSITISLKTNTTLLSTILLILFCSSAVFAQQTDFSGDWKLKGQENISGKLYSNGVPEEMKIIQASTQITVEKITLGQNAEYMTTSETLYSNRDPFVTQTASKRKKVITLKWNADQQGFTEIANVYNATDPAKLEHITTDAWSLTDGELILDRKDQNLINGETWESKSTYDKQ